MNKVNEQNFDGTCVEINERKATISHSCLPMPLVVPLIAHFDVYNFR